MLQLLTSVPLPVGIELMRDREMGCCVHSILRDDDHPKELKLTRKSRRKRLRNQNMSQSGESKKRDYTTNLERYKYRCYPG